jgi:hypothetical protein
MVAFLLVPPPELYPASSTNPHVITFLDSGKSSALSYTH